MLRHWLGGLMVVGACGGSGAGLDPGPPRTVVTSPGEAFENKGPLWPLRSGLAGAGMIVLDPIELAGHLTYPVVQPGLPHVFHGPRGWMYLTSTPDGILLLGNARDGLYPRPLLVVPTVVRHAMTWTVDPGDGGPLVNCRADSPYGIPINPDSFTAAGTHGARSWDIHCARPWAFGDPGTNISFEQRTLVEGWGPGYRGSTVVPLEDRVEAAVPAPPPLVLSPLNGGKPLVKDFHAEGLGAFVNPARDGTAIRLVVMGKGFDASTGPGGNFNTFVPVEGRGCVLYDGTSFTMPAAATDFASLDKICPDPQVAVIGPQGTLDTVGGEGCTSPSLCNAYGPLLGIFPGPLRTQGIGRLGGSMVAGDLHMPFDPNVPLLDNVRPFSDVLFLGQLAVFPDAALWRVGVRDTNLLSSLTAEAGVTRNLRPETYLFSWSVKRTVNGRDDLQTLPDGRVERFHFGEAGLSVEVLGQVALPKGQWLVGAVEQGGALLILTQGEYVGWDTQLFHYQDSLVGKQIEIDSAIKPQLGNAYLWRAALPVAGVTGLLPPARRAISATVANDILSCWATTLSGPAAGCDVRVCWPHDGPATLTGWQFVGVGPRNTSVVESNMWDAVAVADGPSCITVKSPNLPRSTSAYDQGQRLLFGTMPHLGRVMLDLRP